MENSLIHWFFLWVFSTRKPTPPGALRAASLPAGDTAPGAFRRHVAPLRRAARAADSRGVPSGARSHGLGGSRKLFAGAELGENLKKW